MSDQNKLFLVTAFLGVVLVLLCVAVISGAAPDETGSGNLMFSDPSFYTPASGGDGTFVKPTIRDGGPIKTEWLDHADSQWTQLRWSDISDGGPPESQNIQLPSFRISAFPDCPENTVYVWKDGKFDCEKVVTFRISTDPPLPPTKIKCTRPGMSIGFGPEIINCELDGRKFIIEMETK